MTSNKPQKPRLENWVFESELEMAQVHTRMVDQLNQAFSDIKRGLRPKQLIENVIEMVLKILETDPWKLLRYIHDNQAPLFGVASNSINCAVFAGLIYPYIKDQVGSLYLFTRAIILHDIGMLFLPNHILTKMGKLNEKERASLETHPGMGYERLKEWGEPIEVLETALEHHEDWNGKGYPRGISQEEIHPIPRILAPILHLNALLTERPYRGSLVGYWSMKQILKETGTRFSPESVKIMMNVLGLFPPGSLVLLTDGSVCRVMETIYAQPLRPRVRLLIAADGHPFMNETGPIIDLSTAKKLFIAKAISSQDISE